MSLANYEKLYEDLGEILESDVLHEKVADCVTRHIVDAYARGREYGRHLALNEREKIWAVGCRKEVPISKLPRETRGDVQDYIADNPLHPPRSPREVLSAYLSWNGAAMLTDDLVAAMIGIERSVLRDLAPDEPAKAHIIRDSKEHE